MQVGQQTTYASIGNQNFAIFQEVVLGRSMTGYTGSLAPADFSGAVFTSAHFQKITQISSLCDFHYISEGIPSLMRFGLLMT